MVGTWKDNPMEYCALTGRAVTVGENGKKIGGLVFHHDAIDAIQRVAGTPPSKLRVKAEEKAD